MRDMPSWYKEKYHNNPILYACAQVEMTAEEALDYLAVGYDNLFKRACKLAEHQSIIVFIPERYEDE